MKLAVAGRILILLLLAWSAQGQELPPPTAALPPFETPARAGRPNAYRLKVDVNLVLVEATVRDQYGAIVDNLKQEDFHLYEDGVEQQISHFSRDELPLAVALVVDRSGSMAPVLRQLHRVAYNTLSLLKPDDQVALFAFAARAERLEDLTSDRQRVAEGLAAIPARGATVIADALFEAAVYLGRAAPNRRHAIILVSDNENTLKGYANESRVIRQALETETVIYSIKLEEGLHTHMLNVRLPIFRDISAPKIARETGGEVIDSKDLKSVESAMATVISRLKQRYSLGYYSTNRRQDGTFRQIEVRVAEGSNDLKGKFTVYARRGYYARTEYSALPNDQP
jgi:Ca-activated chloride channel homolog